MKVGSILCVMIAIIFVTTYIVVELNHTLPSVSLDSSILFIFMFVFGATLGPIVCVYSSEIL